MKFSYIPNSINKDKEITDYLLNFHDEYKTPLDKELFSLVESYRRSLTWTYALLTEPKNRYLEKPSPEQEEVDYRKYVNKELAYHIKRHLNGGIYDAKTNKMDSCIFY